MTREWRVDELGEETAAVEEDGKLLHVPRWLLPAGTRENDIVKVGISDEGGERRLRLRIDADATRSALEASRRQVKSTPPQNDPGGPIKL
jgi:hypothetical protein